MVLCDTGDYSEEDRARDPRALRHDRDEHDHLEPEGERVAGSVDVPLPEVEVRVTDPARDGCSRKVKWCARSARTERVLLKVVDAVTLLR